MTGDACPECDDRGWIEWAGDWWPCPTCEAAARVLRDGLKGENT